MPQRRSPYKATDKDVELARRLIQMLLDKLTERGEMSSMECVELTGIQQQLQAENWVQDVRGHKTPGVQLGERKEYGQVSTKRTRHTVIASITEALFSAVPGNWPR